MNTDALIRTKFQRTKIGRSLASNEEPQEQLLNFLLGYGRVRLKQ